MNDDILNLEQAVEVLGVSEKTLIKLLREEHVPARKIGREWRFSREALTGWLAQGDSLDYINQNELYRVSKDMPGDTADLFSHIREALSAISANGNNVRAVLENLERDIVIPEGATLRVSYKQQREIEKLEFKIYWNLREKMRLETNQRVALPDET